MSEFLTVMALLFAAYIFVPAAWYAKFMPKSETVVIAAAETAPAAKTPEDSMLRRHYMTQLQSEIERELGPRPTDFNLRRHHDGLVAAKLVSRLQA